MWKPNKYECDIIRDWWLIFGSAITQKIGNIFSVFSQESFKTTKFEKGFFWNNKMQEMNEK